MEPITVAVRIRPPKYEEMIGLKKQKVVTTRKDEHTLQVKRATKTIDNRTKHVVDEFKFDHVYGGNTPQSVIYHDLGKIIVENAVSGINCCLFAYGQTSSGKTHTMLGEDLYAALEEASDKPSAIKGMLFEALKPLFFILPYDLIYTIHEFIDSDFSQHGIIPRVVKEIFTSVRRYSYFNVSCRFVEIYNEKVCDLLVRSKNRQYYDYHSNIGYKHVKNWKDARKLITSGFSNRSTRATAMNDVSSRSHAVFTISLEFQPDENHATIIKSQINLVDLAGSEKTGQIAKCKDERDEGTAINTSLLHLGRVINKLAELSEQVSKLKDKNEAKERIKKAHVPFRDSVLTNMLQSTLGGRAKTIMVATCSPVEKNASETLSTLRYASRASVIKSSSSKNDEEGFDEQLVDLLMDTVTRRFHYKKVKFRAIEKKIYKGNRAAALASPEYLSVKGELLASYNKLVVFLDNKASMFGRKQVGEVIDRVKLNALKPLLAKVGMDPFYLISVSKVYRLPLLSSYT